MIRVVVSMTALMLAMPAALGEEKFDAQKTVTDFWMAKGVSPAVAEGIARQVDKESGGNPMQVSDGGTSFGLYQHHQERYKKLLAAIENNQAWREAMHDDPIASKHWSEIAAAKSPAEASALWQRYFERPAGTPKESDSPRPVSRPRNVEPPANEKSPDRSGQLVSGFSARLSASSDVYHAMSISFK